jgi:hypothetical protein
MIALVARSYFVGERSLAHCRYGDANARGSKFGPGIGFSGCAIGESTPRSIGKDHASLNAENHAVAGGAVYAQAPSLTGSRVKTIWGLFCLLDFWSYPAYVAPGRHEGVFMAQGIIRRFFALCLATMVLAVCAPAQDYKPLIGTWNMTSESQGDPVKWTLILKESGGKLAGDLATEDGKQPAEDLTFADGVLKFKAPYQGADYDIELKSTADKLDGTWSGGGDSGRTSGTKSE